jgi:hypothetical protein
MLRPLEFYQGAHSSEFSRNPDKYGYKFDANGKWYNEHWTEMECSDLSDEIMQGMWDSGRAKLISWDAMGLAGYGYDINWMRQTPLKDLPYQEIFDRKNKYFETYKNLLLNYENLT